MKKIYMTMVAMLCGVAAMAQVEANLDVPEKVEVAQGEVAEFTIGMTSTESLAAVGFRIALPAGCSFATKTVTEYDEELDEDVEVEVIDYEISAGRSQGHDASFMELGENDPQDIADKAEGFVLLAVAAAPNNKIFKKKTGDIITLKMACSAQAQVGDFAIRIKNAAASTLAGVSVPLADVTIPVTITQGTGINSVNADDVNAPVYNLAGQRVSKAQKGIFIQNGKKSIK
jgi:hypothetical protein